MARTTRSIAVLAGAALGAATLVVVGPSAIAGATGEVPIAGTGQLRQVVTTGAAPAPAAASASRPSVATARPADPQQYAADKAAADQAYSAWAASHPATADETTTPATVTTLLSAVGVAAAAAGGATPPDTTGAVNATNYVEFVNSVIAVYARTLASPAVSSQTEDAFTGSTQTCDGQIKWDQQAGRWEYWSLDCGSAPYGWSIGWSKTADPTDLTGGWCKYHASSGTQLDDYGKLGNNDNWLIFGANEFPPSGSPTPVIFTLPKPAKGSTTCPNETFTRFALPLVNAFTPEPANIYGSSAAGYVVATSLSKSALRLYKVTGVTTPAVTDLGAITVPAFAVPASVPQPSPAPANDKIDSSDTRLTQAVAVRDPALGTLGIWTQHAIAGPGGGPSVIRWYELKPGSSTPVQTGTVSAGTNFAFNGAISPTTAGNAAVVDYNVGGPSSLVSLRARSHPASSPAGSMGSAVVIANSAGVDVDFSCPAVSGGNRPCRWGDYAGAVFDPASPTKVWGTAELNGPTDGLNSAQWATRNFALTP